jgi:uncharacterized membrane protein
MGRLRASWQNLLAGFWLIPGAVAVAFAAFAFLLIELDRATDGSGFGFGGDAGAAREILSTIAGSVITVAGITFSLTLVVLTLISSQFTPRALRGFLGDRVNQVVAGSFVGIFLYCLLVLRTVRGEGGPDQFVPALSVTGAIVFGLLALVLVLLFVHHMGQSIQASHIAARVGGQTLESIDRRHPEPYEASGTAEADALLDAWRAEGEPADITPPRAGYVQLIDLDSLERHAPPDARLYVAVRPGDFVTHHTALVRVWRTGVLDDSTAASLRGSFPITNERDLRDDPSYGLQQLTDIAVKALSPGINDPTTAVTCIGYLQAALERLAGRAIPMDVLRSERDAVVVVARRSFAEHAERSFGEIGRYARANARVVISLLDAVRSIAGAARLAGADERRSCLEELGAACAHSALERAESARDTQAIEHELERLRMEPAR